MSGIITAIPVYNGEKHILETLQSLARQTRRPDRVVVVDDGSKDRTEEIVRGFKELECEWAPNERNLGLFPNHNSALRFAKEAKFFHILHANDLIAPTFFETLVPLIERAEGFALAYSGHVFIQENGKRTDQTGRIKGSDPRQISMRDFLASQCELKAIQLHSAVMKTDYRPLPVEFRLDFRQCADVVFHSQFAALCSEIWAHPDILSLVRIHEGSESSKNTRSIQAWVLDEWRAMQMVLEIMQTKGVYRAMDEKKARLLFAARSHVKIKLLKDRDPDFAAQIRKVAKPITGSLEWAAAAGIVAIRDRFFPKPNAYHETLEKSR
jgi:glycosyltransferase involved in cell wall biosynthesis